MRVGLDVFTLSPLQLGPYEVLDYLAAHDLDGALFGRLESLDSKLDPGALRDFRATADGRGLFTDVSAPTCNPCLTADPEALLAEITRHVELAAACGWHELHSSLGSDDNRYHHALRWPDQLRASADFLRRLRPVLHAHGSRLNLETHGDSTTFELVRLAEDVGPDILGICLDTANVLCHCEHPTLAARRAAPYTHLTHVKDAALFFSPAGYTRQGKPIGAGILDWTQILAALGEHDPALRLTIEDHKWLFEFPIYERWWRLNHPDLTMDELAEVVKLVGRCEQHYADGTWPRPAAYEAVPYGEQVEERVACGRDHLRGVVAGLGFAEGVQG
jgi:sugar phosphate isomerase/epimerase